MRIARVALAFFSVGFLAGSFERAAGLGYVDRSQISTYELARADAAIVRFTTAGSGGRGAFAPDLPEELRAPPLGSHADMPDEVIAALIELSSEQTVQPTPVVHSPEAPTRSGLGLLEETDPEVLRGPLLDGERHRSEPDHRPSSQIPPPLSRMPAGPLPEGSSPTRSKVASSDDNDDEVAGAPEFIMPFERGRVTSLFHDRRYHPAIDLAGPLGTPVHATTQRQRVIFTGWRNGYGNTVVTRDDKGRMHLYAHLHRIRTKPGVVLAQGKLLGLLGSTGRSTGPHVHYEVKTRAGAHVNPAKLLFAGRRVRRGLAWNGARSMTRMASHSDRNQPRPR